MLRPEFALPTAGNGERVAARIATQFMIRYCMALAKLGGGDLVRGLILATTLEANVRHLQPPSEEGHTLASRDAVPPDTARKPISVSAVARALSLPYETTRRHINKLLKEGACVRVQDQGVIVPAAYVSDQKEITEMQYVGLRKMLGTLYAAGFDLEGMARGELAG